LPIGEQMSIRTLISVVFILLVIWYVVFVAGTIQYRILKRKTIAIIMKYAQNASDGGLNKSYERLYQALYPEWCEMVKKSAWFIPNRSELAPILANVENVRERFKFSPAWVRACLLDHKINFDADQ
jgi:hypothetical protein